MEIEVKFSGPFKNKSDIIKFIIFANIGSILSYSEFREFFTMKDNIGKLFEVNGWGRELNSDSYRRYFYAN